MRAIRLVVLCIAFGFAGVAIAHKPSDSYLTLQADAAAVDGHWDLALRDLDGAFDLDRNRDGAIDWGELRVTLDAIDAYAVAHLAVSGDGTPCPLRVSDHQIDHHTDGAYLVVSLAANCRAPPATVRIGYSALFDIDAQHRGLLKLVHGDDVVTAVFATERREQAFTLGAGSRWRQFGEYIADGIAHIALGYDHILFLIALLLPSVLGRIGRRWAPVPDLRTALWNAGASVTAFTLAHSVTLSLATLQVVHLPSRLTESLIALSVVLTALDNIVPVLPSRRWLVAFGFGLVHGFGFASVLLDLELPRGALALSLFGFNVGVELGQLVLVALLLPLAFVLRARRGYQPVALRAGSCVIAVFACGWLVERAFDLRFMPF